MTELAQSGAALVISGPDLVPDEITRLLDTSPRHASPGRWELRVQPRTPGDLEAQIEALLAGLPERPEVWHHLAARFSIAVDARLYLDGPNETAALSSATLAMLAERGIELRLDLYAPYRASDSCGG